MKNKCMKGYTMNSRGSCVPVKRTNTKIKSIGKPISSNNNREAMECCFQGCHTTTWRVTCQHEWDSSVGLYQNVMHIMPAYQIGNSTGCEFYQGYNYVRNYELSRLMNRGNYCNPNGVMPLGPDMNDCNHALDWCLHDGVYIAQCAGWYSQHTNPNNTGDINNEFDFIPNDPHQPYGCGNWVEVIPSAPKVPNPFRRGGRVKRRR